jgi:phospholipase D
MKISRTTAKKTIRQVGKLGGINSSVIATLIFGFILGVGFEEINGIGTWHSYNDSTGKINVCFTPPAGCGNLIAREISKAQSSIYVQAYSFTSKSIIRELIRAKQRGVKIRVLLDSSNLYTNDSKAPELEAAGIEVAIDKVSGIAHNKVIIIDKKKVITGSFNFTNAADHHNVENVLLIEDEAMAETYLQNWLSRKILSHLAPACLEIWV